MKTVLIRVEGRVQGVWYRAWTQERAQALGVAGWVRNRRDGAVEALISGPEDAVDRLIEACRDGPPSARVTAVSEAEAEPPSETGFHVRPTG